VAANLLPAEQSVARPDGSYDVGHAAFALAYAGDNLAHVLYPVGLTADDLGTTWLAWSRRTGPPLLHSARPRGRCPRGFAPSTHRSNGARWPSCATGPFHDDFGVDYDLVWDVVRNRVPELLTLTASILQV
jgi:hypothetical protein